MRGESIFAFTITKYDAIFGGPRFVPCFLGEKFPAADFLVLLNDHESEQILFFFAQIKTTSRGYTKKGRLKIEVKKQDVLRLLSFPAPTYVVGIDDSDIEQPQSFIVAVDGGKRNTISSITTDYPLNELEQLRRLWEDVVEFWEEYRADDKPSKLADSAWS